MRALRRTALLLSPFAVAFGCILPSFERIPADEEDVTGGESGSSGSGGTATGGMSPGGQGTMGGEGGIPGGAGGTGGSTPGTIAVYKTYAVEQGTNLGVPANQGLLVYSGAEDRDWTSVTRSRRDTSLPSDMATLDIDPNDGSFTFEPAPELFGVYHATYELGNAADEAATGDLYITVQPVSVDLADVANGVGGFVVSGQAGEGVGKAVAGAGDVDNDGFSDFLVGAPTAAGGAGRVYVVFGGPERGPIELDPAPDAGARYTVLDGAGSRALGTSVSAAGDLDGDDYDDFLVGAPGELGASNGLAYVVRGRPRGELSGPIEAVAAAAGFRLSRSGNENVGALVAGGEDLTGDETPDIVVFSSSGFAFYVVDGTAEADVDLEMESAAQFFGRLPDSVDTAWRALALIGDASGDGAGELLVGTGLVAAQLLGPAASFPPSLADGVFMSEHGVLVENTAPTDFVAASAAADFDGDGAPDGSFCHARSPASDRCRIFIGMPASASDGISVTGFGGGEVRVAGGGDTSGDGLSDLLFTETVRSGSESHGWVIFGRDSPVSSLNVQNFGVRGFSIEGGTLIEAIALGGDIDGEARDGSRADDWLVGDSGADGGNGRVSVIFGGEFSR